MVGNELLDEFAAVSNVRSFSLTLLALGAVVFAVLSVGLNELVQLPWYSALLLAYMFQFALIIWALDRFLAQDDIKQFVDKHTKSRLALLVRERRMQSIRSDLEKHYSRDNQLGFLLDFLDQWTSFSACPPNRGI